MKYSLQKKLSVIGIGLIVLFIILNIVLTYFFIIPFSTYMSQKEMENIAQIISSEKNYESDAFLDIIEEIDEDINVQITIMDSDKNIICTTRTNDYRRNRIGKIVESLFDNNYEKIEEGQTIALRGSKEGNNRITVRVIKKVADNRYAVMFRSYRSLQNARNSAILFDLIVGVILIFLGLIVVHRASAKLLYPIKKMTETAEHISNLEFDNKVEITTEDELGQLGKSINKMSEHLEENVERMQEDIENRKRLVRNLSHEIKSPIAVIMGYADRMKAIISKNPERAMEYCEIISNESGRVDILVKEMLELSKLEHRVEELYLEQISVASFFQNLQKRFMEEHMEKMVSLQIESKENDVIVADSILLERAICNMLNNAYYYGENENLKIKLKGCWNENFYEISVYNSGSSVAEDKINSIWDAFVKVDKARQRGRQGSGVGLSIVKEIVDSHGGYYKVLNVEDGVIFTIAIPKKD